MSTTPRTDAMGEANGMRCNCSEKPIELCCTLETELTALQAQLDSAIKALADEGRLRGESEAREMALRGALRWIADGKYNELHPLTLSLQEDARCTYPERLTSIMRKAEEALTSPAPPCIPLADVRPLVEKAFTTGWNAMGDYYGNPGAPSHDNAFVDFIIAHPELK